MANRTCLKCSAFGFPDYIFAIPLKKGISMGPRTRNAGSSKNSEYEYRYAEYEYEYDLVAAISAALRRVGTNSGIFQK